MKPRPKRIAIVCQPWDNVAPQSGNSIVIIAYQLARYLSGEWQVTLFGRRAPGQRSSERDGDAIEFKRFTVFQKPQAIIEVLLGIVACYRKTRISYLYTCFYHPIYALRLALSIRARKFDVVLVFNFLQFASIIKFFNPRTRVCLNMQCEWLTQFATAANEHRVHKLDLIIGCSDYITEAIKKRFPKVAARCHTVYNGVDIDRFRPTEEGSRNADRLLYVGRLSPEKGVHVLVQAFKILAQSRPGLHLDIVGAPDTPRYLYLCPDPEDRAVASLGLFFGDRLLDMVRRQLIVRARSYPRDLAPLISGNDRIVFHGAVIQTATLDFYRKAAMLVFPSVWHEPFGIPTIEASACGLPVVSTYSGGIPEIVEPGRTGILVARGDAQELALGISRVLDDPALARAMGAAGRNRAVAEFSWGVVSQRLADLIGDMQSAVADRK